MSLAAPEQFVSDIHIPSAPPPLPPEKGAGLSRRFLLTGIVVEQPRPANTSLPLEESDVCDAIPALERGPESDPGEAGSHTCELRVGGAAAVLD